MPVHTGARPFVCAEKRASASQHPVQIQDHPHPGVFDCNVSPGLFPNGFVFVLMADKLYPYS